MIRLTQVRTEKGWSKAELARRSRLDQAHMTRIEQGRATPYPSQLVRLAEALEWPQEKAGDLLQAVSQDGQTATVAV